jgi:hypothetical protein
MKGFSCATCKRRIEMAKRDKRQKASDVFAETNFFLGEKVGFEAAFPQIEDLIVEVEEKGDGVPWDGKQYRYGKTTGGEYVNCSNPRCYNGGFHLGGIIRSMISQKQTNLETSTICQGQEGSPKGRRIYQECMNYFKIKVSITYKQGDSSSDKGAMQSE